MENISEPTNRAKRRAAASEAHGRTKEYGWKVGEWSAAVGCSRARTYQLISAGKITRSSSAPVGSFERIRGHSWLRLAARSREPCLGNTTAPARWRAPRAWI
jgi:hypothetical protein